ncbi:MAG: hypothetical protein ACO2ZD_04040 [Pseudomonadales bacterium]
MAKTKDKTYVHLESSETAILHVASRIYVAHILGGQITERTNTQALMRECVESAIAMAEMTDEIVISDLERR